jgi:hypothetical protein
VQVWYNDIARLLGALVHRLCRYGIIYNDIARLLISVGCIAFEACLHATVHTFGGPCGYFFIAILSSLILYSMLSDPDIAAYGTIYMDLIENN